MLRAGPQAARPGRPALPARPATAYNRAMDAPAPLASLPGVAGLAWVRGSAAAPGAAPDLVLEVAHGATRAAHFDDLRARLRGSYPADLRDFFLVNTDVGAPELAEAVARAVVAAEPTRTALVVRCLVPRTFVDCNRLVDRASAATRSAAGEMTPGIVEWVRDPHDLDLLLGLHERYAALVRAALDACCGQGGEALLLHTYAPRSIDVPVDRDIVARLRAEYAPGRLAAWPLRSEVDLITTAPDGTRLASERLVAAMRGACTAAGLPVAENAAYALHPSTLAHAMARAHPGRTLCMEVRRDLLLEAFVPFVELTPEPARVSRVAAPLARALARTRTG